MNPYVLIAIIVGWLTTTGTAGYLAYDYGTSSTIAAQKKQEDLIREAGEAAQRGAAEAIAKIKPRNTTIQQEVRREIETNTVYRDCRITPDGMRLANEALTGRTQPPGGGKLPGADTPVGRVDGGGAGQAGLDR